MNDPVRRIILNAQKYSYQCHEKSISNKASIEANAEDNPHRTINHASVQKATDLIILAHAIQIFSSALFNKYDIRRIIPIETTGNIHRYNITVAVGASEIVTRFNIKKYAHHKIRDKACNQ